MAALESLVPTDLEVHLQMNSSRFETYDAMRAEVLAFIESRTGSRMTETKVHKHDKGKGKNKFSGSCYICGKVGHEATECGSRDRASNKGSGRKSEFECGIFGKRQVRRARYRRSERTSQRSRQEQKGKSKGRKGFQSGRPADSVEFEEEPWDETNETEPEEWWNSWADGAEQNRDGPPLGAFVVGGTELELNSFKSASGEILPDEGQLMWPCFLQDGRKCQLRGHVTDVHKPLISAGKVLGKDKVAILHSSGGSILSWSSPTGILISRAMTKGPRQAQTDELFYVKDLDGNWQAQKIRYRRCRERSSPQLRRVGAAVVGRQSAGSVQARAERNAEECGEFGAGAPAQSTAEGREEDDEFQRPRSVRFHDEQMYPISKEEREEHELLGHVQYWSWCRHCAAARGVGQQHRQLREDPVDATVPEIVLDYLLHG